MSTSIECLPCGSVKTGNWYAWNNLMPPKPDDFHIIGDIEVPNPGVEPVLAQKVPQGVNPAILLLDLFLVQQPGNWPQVVVTKQVRFDRRNATFEQAQVFCGNEVIADVKVEDVH
ncbi:hypothetical protein Mal4_00290 [Maioricimonas rarisocia]|uniref:Uncharacterized protein n=1 Tax=Maioricimonas rarisocia TaxID=2528026 RepID=A0A517YZU2_9PLAN|nr:hypothetical protein [Maioricimonas rarisocia]QDU35747.1 hypothetical protein Mal4_00290 [Maioricimonas rarisocia]